MNDISIRPAYLAGLDNKDAFAETLGFMQPPRISMRDDRFNILDENGAPVAPASLQLKVVMLWENDTRIYYPLDENGKSTYDPDNPSPPSCFSDNRITPSESALQPQNATCAGCPRAVRNLPSFDGKSLVAACKDKYKVAVLVGGVKGLFLLDIGPASRKAYASYRNFLKAHHALPNQVVTRLDYADKQFQFAFEDWINEATAAKVKQIAETDEPAMIVNAHDRPRQLALPTPKHAPSPFVPAMGIPVDADHGFAPATPEQVEKFAAPAEPPKRRGRPPKETVVGPGPILAAAFAGPSTPPQPAPALGYPSPPTVTIAAKSNGGFGMEPDPQRPDAAMQKALDEAFGR